MQLKNTKIVLMLFLTLILSCNQKETKKFEFQPNIEQGKDAAISAANDSANFSKLDVIHMLSLSSNDTIPNDARFLIRFGFSTLALDKKIDSAFIYLFASDSGHFGTNNSFVVEPVNEAWINDDVNWKNQPNTDSTVRLKYDAPTDKNQDYKIDVTNYVNQVLQNKRPNYGFLFKLEDEKNSYKGLKFHSSESKVEEKRPKIEIYYTE